MEQLRIRSNERVRRTNLSYQREEVNLLDQAPRLLGIKGARGIGKTTILLQHLKRTWGLHQNAIYLSLDDVYFTEYRLLEFVEEFRRSGGQYLYLDEVHRYPNWSIEIKNIYDTYSDLQIYFTGSSMLDINKSRGDLTRRAIIKPLQGLSFRQYLGLQHKIHLDRLSLDQIFNKSNEYIGSLPLDFKPYPLFQQYIISGYYPFFTEGDQWFHERVQNILRTILEVDMPLLRGTDILNVRKILNVLFAIASSPPFKPNISKLSERSQLTRNTLLQYLGDLETADILSLLRSDNKGISLLQKPEKIYFNNTNLIYSLNPVITDPGILRETFVLNQLNQSHRVTYPKTGDFLVDETYNLEVGGKNKKAGQISSVDNAYLIMDDLDYATGNKIPIWLLGLLY
jgi:predicted AAA+ superfamily ATPase